MKNRRIMPRTRLINRKSGCPPRSAAALLVCLFVIFITTAMVVNVLSSVTLELSALRNAMDYERAIYLANAGLHAVAAELEADTTWRGTLTEGIYPADDTYTATAVDGTGNTVDVTSDGAAGAIVRRVVATLEL